MQLFVFMNLQSPLGKCLVIPAETQWQAEEKLAAYVNDDSWNGWRLIEIAGRVGEDVFTLAKY